MAAGFLITRILLVFLLSELDFSSAFPRGRGFVYPEAWQGVRKKQEGYGYGKHRPFQYIPALMQSHSNLHTPVRDHVQAQPWQKPQEDPLKVRSHAQIHPSLYHQAQSQYQPYTKWTQDISPSHHPPQRTHPLPKPRSFEFNLRVPFSGNLGQNKETRLSTKGPGLNSGGAAAAGHYFDSYRPSSVQIYSTFSSAPGSDSKGSSNNPNGGKTAHEVSVPSFHLGFSVPIPPTTPSPIPSSSNDGYLTNLQRPESVDVVQYTYMEPTKPHPSFTQSQSNWILLNSASNMQQQTEQQTYEPVHSTYTDSVITFSPGDAIQHTIPTDEISPGKIPGDQSPVFPQPSAPSFPIPQYPPLPSDNVDSGYYSAQRNPLSNDYGKGQNGQIVSPKPTYEGLSFSHSRYESTPSGHYNAGQVKPSNNYVQHQTCQTVCSPNTFASDQYSYDQFEPSFVQNVQSAPQLLPVQPPSPTVAPSQQEPPSFYQDTTTNYGTSNVVQMGQTDSSSSPYQYSKDQSGQDVLVDLLKKIQALSTDYQERVRPPGPYTGRGQLDGKPNYSKLLVDVEETDEGDGQHNYFAAPSTHYDGYSGTQTEQNMADSQVSAGQNPLYQPLYSNFESYPSHKPESYMPVYNQNPTVPSEVGQSAYYPQKPMEKEQTQISNPVLGQVNYAPHMGA